MTVLEDVSDFIKARPPNAVCDDCIADGLELTLRQHANHKTRELARQAGFTRHRGVCSICKNTKLVISYAHRT